MTRGHQQQQQVVISTLTVYSSPIISFYKADVGGNVKLRDMDEKHMHNLFLKNMSGLIEETKNPSPCMNP